MTYLSLENDEIMAKLDALTDYKPWISNNELSS
jgi:hypothetical protein